MDRRRKNTQWQVGDENGHISWERAGIAVLMDIRDELQTLNKVFSCPNTQDIPFKLSAIRNAVQTIAANTAVIASNTRKKRRRARKKTV